MRNPSGRWRASAVLIVALAAAIGPVRAAEQGAIRPEGYFPRLQGALARAGNGNMIVDAPARRAYQAVVGNETLLHAFDLDTLQPAGTLALPPLQVAQTLKNETEWLWTMDGASHRLFAFKEGSTDAENRLENYRLLVIGLRSLTLDADLVLWPAADRVPLALSYHAPTDKIHVLSRIKPEVDRRSVFFVEEFTPSGTRVWSYRVESCVAAFDSQYAPTLRRSVLQDVLYLNCYNAGAVQGQVVRLRLGAGGAPTGDEEVFPAVPGDLSTMFDPGSDRMFFLTTNSGAGRGAWVFDGLRSTFLGVIATADTRPGAFEYAMGLDPTTGRLYMQTPAGLVVADARRTPLPAGLIFREFAADGLGQVVVDPVRGRLFVADGTVTNTAGHAQRYRVFTDSIAPASDLAPPHPDRLTTDVPEQPGVTDANIAGSARAFGVRALLTGGAQKAAWNAALGRFSPDNVPVARDAVFETVPVQGGNRDVMVARVRGVTLAGRAADASAVALEIDASTQRDVGDRGADLPGEDAECHDDGTQARTASGTAAGAFCDGDTATVDANAQVLSFTAGALSVGATSARSAVGRDQERGLVAMSRASVAELSIAGRVWIDGIVVEAVAWAHGRPGTAGATFTRAITGLRADIDADGDIDVACAQCDPVAAEAVLNGALAGIATVAFPVPDAEWFPNGSAGGYQAIVEKERFRRMAARSLNDDDSTEVPAIEIAMYGDGRAGRTREIFQFAAVQAEAHYGIYLLPQADVRPGARPCCLPIDDPGTVAPPQPPAGGGAAPVPSVRREPVFETVVRVVRDGFRVGVARLDESLLLGAMWLFFAAPALLAVRRRAVARSAARTA